MRGQRVASLPPGALQPGFSTHHRSGHLHTSVSLQVDRREFASELICTETYTLLTIHATQRTTEKLCENLPVATKTPL